jgi:hypothetical protein
MMAFELLRRRWAALTLIVLTAALLALPASAQKVSVAVSDNVVIIPSGKTSGVVDLINLENNPVRFDVKLDLDPTGKAKSDPSFHPTMSKHLRFSPERVMVPGNETRPLRVAFRAPPDLPPGEYRMWFHVIPEPLPGQGDGKAIQEVENGLAVSVAVTPVIPIAVYVRHKLDRPTARMEPLEITPDDEKSQARVLVRKTVAEISYVGTLAILAADTGAVVLQGRAHITADKPESYVQIPRHLATLPTGTALCARLWHTSPPAGAPDQDGCKALPKPR